VRQILTLWASFPVGELDLEASARLEMYDVLLAPYRVLNSHSHYQTIRPGAEFFAAQVKSRVGVGMLRGQRGLHRRAAVRGKERNILITSNILRRERSQ
jgi:hypothetical protein